jgi:2-iminobutanoate/2-iminopropanoate deaminase
MPTSQSNSVLETWTHADFQYLTERFIMVFCGTRARQIVLMRDCSYGNTGPSERTSGEGPKEFVMARQIIFTSNAAKPSPAYSQAVKAAGLVFVSGTAPTDAETGKIRGTTIQERTQQCLTNVAAILEAAGTSMEKIASATVILADEDDFAGMNEEWMRWFPTNPPVRQGAKLPARIPGLKVSIAVIAEA